MVLDRLSYTFGNLFGNELCYLLEKNLKDLPLTVMDDNYFYTKSIAGDEITESIRFPVVTEISEE